MNNELTPNENDLFGEWQNQTQLNHKYRSLESDCQKEYDNMQALYKVTRAKRGMEARTNPEAVGLKKSTDKVIEEYLDANDELDELYKQVIEAKNKLNVAKVGVSDVDTKKYSLQDMVKLYLSGNYSSPSEKDVDPEEYNKAVQGMAKAVIAANGNTKRTERAKKRAEKE